MTSTRQEQVIMGALILLTGLIWFLLVQPTVKERARVAAEAQRLARQTHELQAALTLAKQWKDAAEQAQERLQAFRDRLLPPSNTSLLLAELARPSQSLGVRIISLSPKMTSSSKGQIPIEMVLEGTYLQLGRYLEALLSGPVFLTISDLQLKPVKFGSPQLTMHLSLKAWTREEGVG
ncbi:MAG: type 4a pilus biogenesis protein PilO [Candidatus Methylomirabilales bacterium]